MTKENLITGLEGTTLEEAKHILQAHRIEKLPIVDKDNHLRGLITIKDIEKVMKYPNSAKYTVVIALSFLVERSRSPWLSTSMTCT